jgi:hypothetical protein
MSDPFTDKGEFLRKEQCDGYWQSPENLLG